MSGKQILQYAYQNAIIAQETHVQRAPYYFHETNYTRNFFYVRYEAGNIFRKDKNIIYQNNRTYTGCSATDGKKI